MKQLIFILFTFCVISNTYASDACLHRPGCEELGYTQTRKKCACFNKDVLPCPFNIKDDNTVFCGDFDCKTKIPQCQKYSSIFSGKEITQACVSEHKNGRPMVSYAANSFYVGDKDGFFGQGKWYLPSIGEWMEFYGTDIWQMTDGMGNSGSTGYNKILLNTALETLKNKNVEADMLTNSFYWTATQYTVYTNYVFDFGTGKRNRSHTGLAQAILSVRVASLISNILETIPPKVGDVMYENKSYGSAEDYDGSQNPVGIVASVSENGRSAIILNLKDLTFTSTKTVNNFNPDKPYGEAEKVTQMSPGGVSCSEFDFYDTATFLAILQEEVCGCSCMFYGEETSCDLTAESCAAESKIFNTAACACEACPTNYQFNSETKACEYIACDTTKVQHCAAYNNDCQCTACESGYLLSDGACVPECAKSADTCAKESKIFNAATCTCEACPTNYQFNATTKACDRVACNTAKVANCATYSSAYEPCSCTACKDGYMLENGACVADPCVEKCKIAYPLFAGQENTETIVKKIGKTAYAASQFYVGDKNGDFGQGKWYLPSIGEWLYFYGTDMLKLKISGTPEGLIGDNAKLIDSALSTLNSKGIATDDYMVINNWSSTEGGSMGWGDCQGFGVWVMSSAIVRNYVRDCDTHTFAIRCAMLLEDFYNPSSGGTAPKIGDVIYLDKTYGSATNYNGSKMPVGVISSVSTDGRDVTIINLRFLTLHSDDDDAEDPVYYFDPEHPYPDFGLGNLLKWSADNYTYSSHYIVSDGALLGMARASDNCPYQFYKQECRLNELICKDTGYTGFNAETCKCIY